MDWPETPIEQIPKAEFWPAFCPWKHCATHQIESKRRPAFYRQASHMTRFGSVPRFRCRTCGRTCSQKTFATTYYLKRPELLPLIAAGLIAGSAHAQIARSLDCARSTVTRIAARLGRHSLLLHALSLKGVTPTREPITYDDLETFAYSQDLPCGIGTATGCKSWFGYSIQFAPHRRGGLKRGGRPRKYEHDPSNPTQGSYRRAFRFTLDVLLSDPSDERLNLLSDGHPDYPVALADHPKKHRVRHEIYPNPKVRFEKGRRTSAARLRDGKMFPNDLLHMLIRHSQSAHKRETIAIGRRHNAILERGFLFLVWRNFVKCRTERVTLNPTPAMYLGLTDSKWSWTRLLSQRLFAWQIPLPEPWERIYRRQIVTSQVGRNLKHELKHAF